MSSLKVTASSFLRQRATQIALPTVICVMAIAIFGPFIAPFDPNAINLASPLSAPGGAHLLGTDNLGRDVLSRFLWGGREVILIPLAAVALSYLIAVTCVLFALLSGRAADMVVTKLADLLITLPPLLIVLVFLARFGSAQIVLVLCVTAIFTPRICRYVRAAALPLVTSGFVQSAVTQGESWISIVFREMLPNLTGPLLADASMRVSYGIVFVATLNFLGMGAQPPSSDWGLSVASSRAFIMAQPYATIAPAVGIALIAIALNLCAESLSRSMMRQTKEWVI